MPCLAHRWLLQNQQLFSAQGADAVIEQFRVKLVIRQSGGLHRLAPSAKMLQRHDLLQQLGMVPFHRAEVQRHFSPV